LTVTKGCDIEHNQIDSAVKREKVVTWNAPN